MRRFIVRKEIERWRADPKAAHLHWLKGVYCNFHVTTALVSTAPGTIPTNWVGLEPLGVEVAVDWVTEKTPGAIQVSWGRTREWCEFSFADVMEQVEGLEVEYGWIRRLPFRLADGRFFLHLGADDVQPSVPALRKRGLLEGWQWR